MSRFAQVVMFLGISFGVQAFAATYEWTDSSGVVHFTDNPDKIPPKYRNRVRERESMGGEGTPAQQKEVAPGGEDKVPAAVPTNGPGTYGGHDEQWWRNEFATRRGNVKELSDDLADKERRLTELRRKRVIYARGRDREAYFALGKEVEDDRTALKEAQKRLEELESDATTYGVPMGWRQ